LVDPPAVLSEALDTLFLAALSTAQQSPAGYQITRAVEMQKIMA
jgi:hypothetical protein